MRSYLARRARAARNAGFTIPELLVVIGVIAVLIAVLLPALLGAKRTADMAKSQSNLKQIATWMRMYSSENREYIVPSQFNYSASAAPPVGYPVKVRSDAGLGALRYQGTWSDIIWTYASLGESAGANALMPAQYAYDSPDRAVYDANASYDENVLRAAAPNSSDFPPDSTGTGPKPFGTGAAEITLPGFFAANNFFNTGPNNTTWFTTGQIKAPDRSLYIVDSFAGETIEPLAAPYDNVAPGPGLPKTVEVDFRYSGACLILFLDGHISAQTAWTNLNEVQGNRRIKVQNLDRN